MTIQISTANLPQTVKISKKDSEEVAEQKREANEKARAERKGIVNPIAEKVSRLKRDFLGAPIRNGMQKAIAGKANEVQPCEIPYRPDEKYWVLAPSANSIEVVFSLNFNKIDKDKTRDGGKADFAIAKVLLIEFNTVKNVQNPVVIQFLTDMPPEINEKFPNAKNNVQHNSGYLLMSKSY